MALGEGGLLMRLSLRTKLRGITDAASIKAITAAIADGNFANDLAAEGTSEQTGAGIGPGLLGLLTWFENNWQSILDTILALFGIPTPAKTAEA